MAGITALCKTHGLEPDKYIADGVTVADFRGLFKMKRVPAPELEA